MSTPNPDPPTEGPEFDLYMKHGWARDQLADAGIEVGEIRIEPYEDPEDTDQ